MIAQAKSANRLLQRLDAGSYERLMGSAIEEPLVRGRDLATAGSTIRFCWFPTAGLVSLIAVDADGGEAEAGMIGREGLVNMSVALGDDQSPVRILVQVGGTAIRVEARDVRAAMAASPSCAALFYAYIQSFTIQVGASALAYARYTIARRLARWLLMSGDRIGDADIALTHESLAIMLGVRRPGVTLALQELEATGAIRTYRSRIEVVDRPKLLELCGTGYGLPEAEYDRLIAAR